MDGTMSNNNTAAIRINLCLLCGSIFLLTGASVIPMFLLNSAHSLSRSMVFSITTACCKGPALPEFPEKLQVGGISPEPCAQL